MTTLALTTVDLARMQFATTSIFLTHRRAGLDLVDDFMRIG